MSTLTSDCCGGSPPYTLATEIPVIAAIGTNSAIAGVTLNPILFSGERDATPVITPDRPWFSPPDTPASAMVTRISVSKFYDVLGFANGCFPDNLKLHNAQEVMHPQNWWRFAEIMVYSYISMRNAAHRAQYHWPSLRIGKIAENDAGPIVGTLMAYSDDTLFIFCSGSSNNFQLALQAASSFEGLVGCGNVRTSRFWCGAWNSLASRYIDYHFPGQDKIVVCGHSYGGVMAAIFAARIKGRHPDKDVSLITLGMPCPGDQSFREALASVRSVHLVNYGDGVSAIPPAGGQRQSIQWLLTLGQVGAWEQFAAIENRYMLSAEGKYTYTNQAPTSYDVLASSVAALAAGMLPDPFAAHDQAEYLRRCRIIAGLPV